MKRESSARRTIRSASENAGLLISRMEWEPISAGPEMQGASGGWYVEFEGGGHALGLNVAEVVEWIEKGYVTA